MRYLREFLDLLWPPNLRRVVVDTVSGYGLDEHLVLFAEYRCSSCGARARSNVRREPRSEHFYRLDTRLSIERPSGWRVVNFGKTGAVYCPDHETIPLPPADVATLPWEAET